MYPGDVVSHQRQQQMNQLNRNFQYQLKKRDP